MRDYTANPLARATELAAQLNYAIDDIGWALEKLPEAIHRGLTDSNGPSASFGEHVGGSRDHTGAMLNKLDNQGNLRADEAARDLAKLVDAVKATRAMAQLARTMSFKLCAMNPDEAAALILVGSNGGSCKVCSVVVLGTRDDRLRSGRCPACNWYFREHGVECPKEVWEARTPKRRKVKG